MSTATKSWLIIAFSLILIGCILFASVMTTQNWNFKNLSTTKYETNSYDILEECKNIQVLTDTADISFVPSKDEKNSVVCYEAKNTKHSVTLEDGSLVIKLVDKRKWYDYIGITFGTPKITVYLPEGEYGALSVKASTGDISISEDFTFNSIDISLSTGNVTGCASSLEDTKIKTSTGDIKLEKLSAASLDLAVSTGKVTLNDISCNNLTSSGNTGKVLMENVTVLEKLSIKRSTGDIRFENCDAAEIVIETDTGDVGGSLLSDKIFITKTDTGRINVPKTASGGRCEITTDTGDIDITID